MHLPDGFQLGTFILFAIVFCGAAGGYVWYWTGEGERKRAWGQYLIPLALALSFAA